MAERTPARDEWSIRASVATAAISVVALLGLSGSGPGSAPDFERRVEPPAPTATTIATCVVDSVDGSLDEYEFMAASASLIGVLVVDPDGPCGR